jgi:hypothetical protein
MDASHCQNSQCVGCGYCVGNERQHRLEGKKHDQGSAFDQAVRKAAQQAAQQQEQQAQQQQQPPTTVAAQAVPAPQATPEPRGVLVKETTTTTTTTTERVFQPPNATTLNLTKGVLLDRTTSNLSAWAGSGGGNSKSTSNSNSDTPVTVFIHVGKCGSTTIRDVLHRLQDKTPHDEWLCALEAKHGKGKITAHDVWPKTCDGAEVLLRADYGACGYLDRPCRYLVTLREPMSRLVSEYQYFCRECREQGKFCGKDVTTGCPDLSFLDWAEKHANQYTRHFSHAYVTADEYYDSYVHGFAGLPKLEDRDVDAAAAMLSGKIGHDVKLLWTEELDHGWHELAEWMPGTRVSAQLKQLLRTTDTSELHSNENDSTGRYWPTPQEKARSCGYNWADCQLYERLSGRKCQCGQ